MTGRTLFTAAAARDDREQTNTIAWRAASLDIGDCDRVEFVTAAPEDCPQWFATWPEDIRQALELAIRRHIAERAIVVRAVTFAVTSRGGGHTCVAIVHFHRSAAEGSPPAADDRTAAPTVPPGPAGVACSAGGCGDA